MLYIYPSNGPLPNYAKSYNSIKDANAIEKAQHSKDSKNRHNQTSRIDRTL